MTASTAWLVIRVVLGLLPQIIAIVEAEKNKQAGRNEIVLAVFKRFQDAMDQADKNRADASKHIDDNGLPNTFRRD